MEHPKDVGDRSMLAIMYALRARGYDLLVPFGENTRYDLVIDNGRSLAKVQCKTGRLRAGAIHFATCSTYAHHPNPKLRFRPYGSEVDVFAVYCAGTGCVYLIPSRDIAPKRTATLRVTPARNQQRRGIRPASQYEIAQIELPTAGPGARAGG